MDSGLDPSLPIQRPVLTDRRRRSHVHALWRLYVGHRLVRRVPTSRSVNPRTAATFLDKYTVGKTKLYQGENQAQPLFCIEPGIACHYAREGGSAAAISRHPGRSPSRHQTLPTNPGEAGEDQL